MGTWPSSFLQGLDERPETDWSERPGLFIATLAVTLPDTWEWLRRVCQEAEEWGIAGSISDSQAADGYDLTGHEYDSVKGHKVTLQLVKPSSERGTLFLTRKGLQDSLLRDPVRFEEKPTVYLAEMSEQRILAGLQFIRWNATELPDPEDFELGVSPRKFVRSLSSKAEVPKFAVPWLLPSDTPAWIAELMQAVATHRLALCLASELLEEDGKLAATVGRNHNSARAIPSPNAPTWSQPELSSAVQAAAEWIFEGKDAEARHGLLATELDRVWPTGADWAAGLRDCLIDALASAKTAYRLHLHEKGSDALKLMSDLRKGLSDDVRAVSAQMGTLTTALWRDTAIALGAVVVRFASSGSIGNTVPIIAAIYLSITAYLTATASSHAVRIIEDGEASFRNRLYGPLLQDEEYEILAGQHYRKAISRYRSVRKKVVTVYIVAVAFLAALAAGSDAETFIRFLAWAYMV